MKFINFIINYFIKCKDTEEFKPKVVVGKDSVSSADMALRKYFGIMRR